MNEKLLYIKVKLMIIFQLTQMLFEFFPNCLLWDLNFVPCS